MANWYVSSVAYTAVAQWAATHAYATGAIVRQLATPAEDSERCFRVTAGGGGNSGGSEPTWNLGNNATTTDGALTWTECTGQEAHQHDNGVSNTWTAPAHHLGCISGGLGKNSLALGDTVFLSSDHAATSLTHSGTWTLGSVSSLNFYFSVDRTSSNLPPLPANLLSGAAESTSGSPIYGGNSYWYGISLTSGRGSSGVATIQIQDNIYLDTCALINATTSTAGNARMSWAGSGTIVLDNTTCQFGSTGTNLNISSVGRVVWKNTPSAIAGATIPTTLFGAVSAYDMTVRGVDLSAITGTLFVSPGGLNSYAKLANCKLGAGVTIAGGLGNFSGVLRIELINCDSSNTNYNNYWTGWAGTTSTETTITRTGGATDGATKASRKMVSTANATKVTPWEHHIYQWNAVTGSGKTATVEIISSGTLNNDEIWGELEYLGDSGDCLGKFVNDFKATWLSSGAAQTSSSAAWDNSPSTPQRQKLAVSFTAQKAGLLHFVVKLAKASTTVYVDHLITVS